VIIDYSGFSFVEYKPISLNRWEEPTAWTPHYLSSNRHQFAKCICIMQIGNFEALKYAPNCYRTADNQGC